jgi:magnesium transporter
VDKSVSRARTETAGNLAVARVPIFRASLSAADTRALLRATTFDAVDAILVIDNQGHFSGAAQLKDVLTAADQDPLASLTLKDWPWVGPDVDQEHAAALAHQHGVTAIPVVAADGRPLGLIPALALLETLAQEHHEDIHRLAGILKMRSKERHALDDPPWSRAGRRLPWLLVGLALSTAATAMMVGFEHVLKTNIIISFFIPALVYLADAVGTQTEAVVVRGLSLRMRPLGPLLVGEMATGALIGLPLALLAFLGIWLVFQDFRLAIGVAAALFAASTIASILGLLLPWLLARLGTDPAFGSGPVATIIQDVLTIAIYFAVMTVVMTV